MLFILASATAIIGGSLLLPIDDESYLTEVPAHEAQIASGVLLEFVLVFSVLAIAVLLFPVLKRQHEGLALGYVGVRILEAVVLLSATMSALFLLAYSQGIGATGGSDSVGDALVVTREWSYLVGSMVVFGVGAVLLNTLLFQAELVPRWLSLWGLVGGVLIVGRGILEMYGLELSVPVQALFAAPIALQEMVFALWLIVRGFAYLPALRADLPAETGVGT